MLVAKGMSLNKVEIEQVCKDYKKERSTNGQSDDSAGNGVGSS
jgi:hypothetical protein